jgi:hypothetical protein
MSGGHYVFWNSHPLQRKISLLKVPFKLHYKSLLGALWIDKSFWLVMEGTFVHFLPTPNDHKRNGVEAWATHYQFQRASPDQNQCCAIIRIYKELMFLVYKLFQHQKTSSSGILKKSESKNWQFSWENQQWTNWRFCGQFIWFFKILRTVPRVCSCFW